MPRNYLSSEHHRLRDLTRRNLMQLVESEFTLAHTMTDLAETEALIGNGEHARVLLGKVRQAIAAAQECLANVNLSEEEKSEIIHQFGGLEPRLQVVGEQIGSPSGERCE